MRPVHPFAAFLLLVAAPLVAQEKVDFARAQAAMQRAFYRMKLRETAGTIASTAH